jgi:transcriptional regulator
MAGRPITEKANIPAIKKLQKREGSVLTPIIAYTMRQCGCSYAEIAKVTKTSRQGAEYIVKQIEEAIK